MDALKYLQRVYAGVLGKLIGVYLGRPFEGWTYTQISERLGDVTYYVHDRLNKPLVVTDDDISGTLLFLRALPDYDHAPDLTPADLVAAVDAAIARRCDAVLEPSEPSAAERAAIDGRRTGRPAHRDPH